MFKNIIIHIRDFCYHFSKKQGGEKFAEENYKWRIIGFILIYYVGFTFLIVHLLSHFKMMPINKNTPFLGRIVFSIIFIFLPISLIVKWMLKIIEFKPINPNISLDEYKKSRNISMFFLVIGILFFFSCMLLPIYFQGGRIDIGNYVIQRK